LPNQNFFVGVQFLGFKDFSALIFVIIFLVVFGAFCRPKFATFKPNQTRF
jgi:hypothetical protein